MIWKAFKEPLYRWYVRMFVRRSAPRDKEDRRKPYDGNDTRKETKGGWCDRRGGPIGG